MTENRPYRNALSNEDIIRELEELVTQNKLEPLMVQKMSSKIDVFVQAVNRNVSQKNVS